MNATKTRNRLSTHGPGIVTGKYGCKYRGCKRSFSTLHGRAIHVGCVHVKSVHVKSVPNVGSSIGAATRRATVKRRYTCRQPVQAQVYEPHFCPLCGFNLAMLKVAFTVAQKHGV